MQSVHDGYETSRKFSSYLGVSYDFVFKSTKSVNQIVWDTEV